MIFPEALYPIKAIFFFLPSPPELSSFDGSVRECNLAVTEEFTGGSSGVQPSQTEAARRNGRYESGIRNGTRGREAPPRGRKKATAPARPRSGHLYLMVGAGEIKDVLAFHTKSWSSETHFFYSDLFYSFVFMLN